MRCPALAWHEARMKITMADADLTEFDRVAFVVAWALAIGVVVFQPRAFIVMMMVIPLLYWARRRRQRPAD